MIMYAATGRRYGPCPVVVQPAGQCAPDPLYRTYAAPGGGLATPFIDGGQWYNGPYAGDGDRGACCTTSGCEVALQGPTTKALITAVTSGKALHTFHIHQPDFVITRINGVPQPDSVHLDNVFLGIHKLPNGQWAGDTVTVRFK